MKKKNGTQQQTIKRPLNPDHRLVTRRDFLAQGLIDSAALVMAPTVLSLLLGSNRAFAADTCDGGALGATMPAVLIFDHSGGAGLLGQTVPLSFGDAPLAATGYQALGMNVVPTAADIDNSWGINFHNKLSFLNTLNATVGASLLPTLQSKVNSFHTVQRLDDDSSNNMVNPAGGLALLGAIGDTDRKVAPVIGTSSSVSGGNSAAAVAAPLFRSTVISSPSSAANLVSTGRLIANLGNSKVLSSRVVKAMQNMSAGQLSRYSQQDLPTQVSQLVSCGYVKASAMTGTPQAGVPGLDPTQNAIITSTFTMTNSTEARTATLTYLLAMGFSGVATMVLGGRDYHGSTRQSTEAADAEAGKLTAKALSAFHQLVTAAGGRPRPLMIIHLTDGGVSANKTVDTTFVDSAGNSNYYQWTSDRGTANASYVFMYDPAGKPQLARNQLGFSTTVDGGVDTRNATPFSSNAVALAEVMMANYLQLAGQPVSNLNTVFPSAVLSPADMLKYGITTKA